MQIWLRLLFALFVGQSLAVLNNSHQDLASNKPGAHTAESNQYQNGLTQLSKDGKDQSYNGYTNTTQNNIGQDVQGHYPYKGLSQPSIDAAISEDQGLYQVNESLNSEQLKRLSQETVPIITQSLQPPYEYSGPSLQNSPPTQSQSTVAQGHFGYYQTSQLNVATSFLQDQQGAYQYKGPSPQNLPAAPTQDQQGPNQYKGPSPTTPTQNQPGSNQYKGPSAQNVPTQDHNQYNRPSPQNLPATPIQNQQGPYQYKGPSSQNVPATATQNQQDPYQYKGPSPQNLPATPIQNQQGPYQYKGPSSQNVPAAATQNQQDPYQYKGPSPQNNQQDSYQYKGTTPQIYPVTSTQNQLGSYQYQAPSPQTFPATPTQNQLGSYQYQGPFPETITTTQDKQKPSQQTFSSAKNQQVYYQYKGPSPQALTPTQSQQGPDQYKGQSSQNAPAATTQGQQVPFPQYTATYASQNHGPPQTPRPQNNTRQNSPYYSPQPEYNHFNRPYHPHETTQGTSQYNKPFSNYLPPSTSEPTTESLQHQATTEYPKPSQHYLPPVLADNQTSAANTTYSNYQSPYQKYLSSIPGSQEQNRTTTSAPPTTTTSSVVYHGPGHQYLPAATVRPNRTTPGRYFAHQHWNPIKTNPERPNTTSIPSNSQGPVALHQGYRYNTPAQKQVSSFSQTFNGVIYNELGMGMNTSKYFFVPGTGPSGKTEVETQQGYVYGRPENRPNENLDSVTHLIPVPTMPSSYIYYKPPQKFGDTQEPQQNLTSNYQETNGITRPSSSQESNGNSRPSSLQQTQQESTEISGPSFDYTANQKIPLLQHTQQVPNENARPSYDYAPNHKNPSTPQTQQESIGNGRPSSDYPTKQKPQSFENSRPSTGNPAKHPYFTEQYQAEAPNTNVPQAGPSLVTTRPLNTPTIHPPQYSFPEYAGNFRPSTGVSSDYYTPAHSQNSPESARPENFQPTQQAIPPYAQKPKTTPEIPNGRPIENHMYHHPGAMANSENYQNSQTTQAQAGNTGNGQKHESSLSFNQLANRPEAYHTPTPQREPTIYAPATGLTSSQNIWSQLQGDKVQSPPGSSNISPTSQSGSLDKFVPNQWPTLLWSQANQNSPSSSQTEPYRNNHLSPTAEIPSSHSLVSAQDNRQASPGQAQIPQGIASPQSNDGSSTQLSNTPFLPTSAKVTFPAQQTSSQGSNTISPASQTFTQQNLQQISSQNNKILPAAQTFPQQNLPTTSTQNQINTPPRTPNISLQFHQQNIQISSQKPTPSNYNNSKYPPLPQTQMQRQRNEAQRLTSSINQTVDQNLNNPKQFLQNTQETFLAKPSATPEVSTPRPISNFFGPSGYIPASSIGNEDTLNHDKTKHKPMTFVDTTVYQQMPSHSFEVPPYYTVIPRNRPQGLPQLPPLTGSQAPVVNKNSLIQNPITVVSNPEQKPLVYFRTSLINNTPSLTPAAKPIVFVESPVVPQEPIRQPHLVYGSPLYETLNSYLPPSGVVQPPYYKK